jgi:hypothetical protein
MGLCLLPGIAWSADWSLDATAAQTIGVNDNVGLAPSPKGWALQSYSSLSAMAERQTAASKFDLNGNVNFRKYWGAGVADLPQSDNFSYTLKAYYEFLGEIKSDRTWIEASFGQQTSAFAQFSSLGTLASINGTIARLSFRGGMDRSVTDRDSLSVALETARTAYDPSSSGTAFRDTTGSVSWKRKLTALTTLTASADGELATYENAGTSDVLILRGQAGFDTTLTPRVKLQAKAGVSHLETLNGVGTVPATLGYVGDMRLSYQPTRSMTALLIASRTVSPNILGTLSETSTAGLNIAQEINSESSVALAASWNQQNTTASIDYASATLTYSYRWSAAWTASATYGFTYRFQSPGTTAIDPLTNMPVATGLAPASSNSLMVTVSRRLTGLGL